MGWGGRGGGRGAGCRHRLGCACRHVGAATRARARNCGQLLASAARLCWPRGQCKPLLGLAAAHLMSTPRRSALVYLFLRRSWPDRSENARLLPLPARTAVDAWQFRSHQMSHANQAATRGPHGFVMVMNRGAGQPYRTKELQLLPPSAHRRRQTPQARASLAEAAWPQQRRRGERLPPACRRPLAAALRTARCIPCCEHAAV